MNFKTLITTTALCTFGAMATAQDAGDFTAGFGLSTFGLNLEGAYQIDPQLRVRGALMGGFSADYDETDEDGTVEGDFDLGGLAILADYYPMQNGWRISGGVFFSNTELSATGTVDVSGVDEEATVSAAFANDITPMLTTGYEWRFSDGWSLNTEAGVLFIGGIDVDFDATDASAQDSIDNDPEVQDAIDDAGDINAFPYLSIGVSYTY